jgi:Ser/Thr protein kinase RdoA (MazF antagonist)
VSSEHPSTHPYTALIPEVILDAVETFGLRCTGALYALNSYENRVYRVETEERGPIAAKFYRPGRWPDEAIREEHEFALELAAQEIPVVAPLPRADGATLAAHAGFRFTLFPWQGGRVSELNLRAEREILGRYLGRLHRVGRSRQFQHRPTLTVDDYGREAARYILENRFLPDYLEIPYRTLTDQLLALIGARFEAIAPQHLRLHGDCHLGNLLWTEPRQDDGNEQGRSVHIVDFDDCRTGPAMQDLWMLLSGTRADMEQQLGDVLAGYTRFMEFDASELALLEPLRTLRLLHYSAWLARRWDDPAFPINFPWFNTPRYWEEQILNLREQLALLEEPPLAWRPD